MAEGARLSRRLSKSSAECFSQSVARLQQASTTAVTALLKVMVEPATPASARVRAADIVLSHASNAIELDEIEARLPQLEQAAANR